MLPRLFFAALLSYASAAQESSAPVVIDGKEILRVYGPIGTFSAADRAPEIEKRIVALADHGFAGVIETRPIPSENATAVIAGSAIVMAATDIDAQVAGVSREQLAQRYAD